MMDPATTMLAPQVACASSPADEESHRLGVKMWFDEVCTAKKLGLTAMVKNVKPKVMVVLPWRVCFIKGDVVGSESRVAAALCSEKVIRIDAQLSASVNKKEVTLEYYEEEQRGSSPKPTRETFTFESEEKASRCVAVIEEERARRYIHSENFTPKFKEDLDTVVRMKINGGDDALKDMYLACCNQSSPLNAIEALFTNYRSMMDFEESAVSLADLLSAVAQDPVVLILFLCCKLDAGRFTYEYFRKKCGYDIDSSAELFEKLLNHIVETVRKPSWQSKRALLLAQFLYPLPDAPTSGITTYAVYCWIRRFTDNYHKLPIDIFVLNRLMQDEKYLCYICLDHHAQKGYTELVETVFPTVPQEYLFSTFDIDVSEEINEDDPVPVSADSFYNPTSSTTPNKESNKAKTRGTMSTHFVDFLFHRNLSKKSVFLNLLNSFKAGGGYDDKFFAMFLKEAIVNDRPRVAVDVILNILFTAEGEPSVHALKMCPKFPVILFDALVNGILNAGAARHQVSDDMRLLFEVSLRFQYFSLRKELLYLKKIDHLFRDQPEKIDQFNALVREMAFLPYVISVCNHNLTTMESVSANNSDKGGNNNNANGVYNNPASRKSSAVFAPPPPPVSESNGNLSGMGSVESDDIPNIELNPSTDGPDAVSSDVGDLASQASVPTTPAVKYTTYEDDANSVGASTTQSRSTRTANHTGNPAAKIAVRRGTSALMNGSGGDGQATHWMARSPGNLVALIYGFMTLVISCGPIPDLKDSSVEENEILVEFLNSMAPSFYTVLLQPNTALRARIIDFLQDTFSIVALYQDILSQPVMLSKAQHFQYSFLHALSFDAHFLMDCMVSLITVAVKLEQFDSLYSRLSEIDCTIGRSQEQQQQLEVILFHVIDRDSAELLDQKIKLQDLAGFATAVTEALAQCRGKADAEHAVLDRVRELLVESPVAEWKDGFGKIKSL